MQAELKKRTNWLIILGVLTIILGVIALLYSVTTTIVTAVFFGILLVIGGISEEVFSTKYVREKTDRFLHLLLGLFAIVVGVISVVYPVIAAESLTILLGAFLTTSGLFMLIGAPLILAAGRGWMIANGIISLLLGVLILVGWPMTGLWVIGLFIGIYLIFRGLDMAALGFLVKKAA